MNKISTTMETVTSTLHSLVQRVNNIAQIINTNNYPTTFLPLQHTKILDNLNIHQPQTTMQIIKNIQDPSFAEDTLNNTKVPMKTND